MRAYNSKIVSILMDLAMEIKFSMVFDDRDLIILESWPLSHWHDIRNVITIFFSILADFRAFLKFAWFFVLLNLP